MRDSEQFGPKKLQSVVVLSDYVKKCLNDEDYRVIYTLPLKLPMLCKPKEFSENSTGGYLLNEMYDNKSLFIEKHLYRESSTIYIKNDVYPCVNSFMACPYKINKSVLEFIYDRGIEKGLIIDHTIPHEYEHIDEKKRTKYQQSEYQSHKSQLYLQNNIMHIVSIFKDVPKFYFPVRLDQRGRLYCDTVYFTYQGTDLAKCLINFAIPDTLDRNNKEAIEYFYVYGANCFGMNKESHKSRVEWVKKNIDIILDFENNDIINKAKNP